MRYIIKQGAKMFRYRCEACGQIELLSAELKPICSNCSCTMKPDKVMEFKEVTPEPEPDTKTQPGAVTEITPEEKPKKKLGRPPKVRVTGPSCSTCSKALVAEKGLFTCKIDCESKTGMDYCGKYAEGTPYGSER